MANPAHELITNARAAIAAARLEDHPEMSARSGRREGLGVDVAMHLNDADSSLRDASTTRDAMAQAYQMSRAAGTLGNAVRLGEPFMSDAHYETLMNHAAALEAHGSTHGYR
jgi:hypothetical protein